MSEFPAVAVVGGIIIPTLIFIVGLLSAKSSRVVARVFMLAAIVWMLIASSSDYRVVYQNHVVVYSYDTPTAVVKHVILLLMIVISVTMLTRRAVLNRKAAGNIDEATESKPDEYYDDLI